MATNSTKPIQDKLWSKDFVLAMISNVFAAFIFYLLMTTMAQFAFKTYHVNASIAGLCASIFIFGSLFGRIFTGRYLDILGRRKVLIISTILMMIFCLIYLIKIGLVFLLIVRTLHGFIFGIASTSIFAVATSYIPDSRKGEGIGFFSISTTLSTALGPFLGVWMTQSGRFDLVFLSCTGFLLISIVFLFFMKIPEIRITDTQREAKKGFDITDFFEPRALSIAVIALIFTSCYSGITSFMSPYAESRGMIQMATMFFVSYAVALVISRPLTGKLHDRRGDNFVMVPCTILYAVSLLLITLAKTPVMFILAAFVMGFGLGSFLAFGQTIAAKAVPPHRVAMSNATFYVFADTGLGLGPLFLGIIVDHSGYSAMYLTETCIIAASLLLYYPIHGRKAAAARK
ncbi:MAG: MFS transporter [Clostridiales Family XIII bacterium]|jgi:MFS family permease|nr:MFS transporter [Clostridiales Family XIII bacterium]